MPERSKLEEWAVLRIDKWLPGGKLMPSFYGH
jgi:hypothetical protein